MPVPLVMEEAAFQRWGAKALVDESMTTQQLLQTKAAEVTKMQQLQEWPWIGWPILLINRSPPKIISLGGCGQAFLASFC